MYPWSAAFNQHPFIIALFVYVGIAQAVRHTAFIAPENNTSLLVTREERHRKLIIPHLVHRIIGFPPLLYAQRIEKVPELVPVNHFHIL